MENRPEYVATWLGLAKIGVIPALINHNLKNIALAHAIQSANCLGLIYGFKLTHEISEIHSNLNNGSKDYPIFLSGPPSQPISNICSAIDLNENLVNVSKDPVPQMIQDSIGFNDKLLYIYTSGTTGAVYILG